VGAAQSKEHRAWRALHTARRTQYKTVYKTQYTEHSAHCTAAARPIAWPIAWPPPVRPQLEVQRAQTGWTNKWPLVRRRPESSGRAYATSRQSRGPPAFVQEVCTCDLERDYLGPSLAQLAAHLATMFCCNFAPLFLRISIALLLPLQRPLFVFIGRPLAPSACPFFARPSLLIRFPPAPQGCPMRPLHRAATSAAAANDDDCLLARIGRPHLGSVQLSAAQ